MYFYLLIALKLYCLYHFYKNRTDYYWVFIILFIPVLGPLAYLLTQVYNKRDAEKLTGEITHIINPTKKIKDLEKQLKFSESYQNRVNLADAYLEIKDYDHAILHYKEALDDGFNTNFYVIKNLITCYYNTKDYKSVIAYAEKISNHTEFKKSRTQFLYGLALEKEGDYDIAEANLRQIDVRFSFYEERLVLAKYLLDKNKKQDALDILEELNNEAQHMTKPNKRLYKTTIQEAKKLLITLNVSA